MIDDIGLGSAIASSIYVAILIIGICLAVFFLKRKKYIGLVLSVSLFSNLFLFLFLMGKYGFYPGISYALVNKYWPIINIFLLVVFIISIIKNRGLKKNA